MTLEEMMGRERAEASGISKLTDAERAALLDWGLEVFGYGMTPEGMIDRIRFGGKLVILDDGTQWEVDDVDSITVDSWGVGARVVVIDDEMFHLDDADRVAVERDLG